MNQYNFSKISDDLEFLLRRYTVVSRTTVNPFRVEQRLAATPQYEYTPGDDGVYESLLEHVGCLPVLATYFHAYLSEQVDIGRALSMLAIHDIGELQDGDKNTFLKSEEDAQSEVEVARSLLDTQAYDLFLEFEASQSNDAKFANSIDKIAPDIFDLFADSGLTSKRLAHYANMSAQEIPRAIAAKKSPHMQWSTFFRRFHADLIDALHTKFSTQA